MRVSRSSAREWLRNRRGLHFTRLRKLWLDASGEPLTMVYENDGLWRTRLTEIFGAAEATAIMTQLELGQGAAMPGTYNRETLAQLRFHPDLLKIA